MVTDRVWQETARHFSGDDLLDLVVVAGFYGYASRLTNAMGVEIDEGLMGIAAS